MARIDHVAFESDDPDGLAAFYERILDARVVKAEGHPVMAYLGNTGLALHERGGPGATLPYGSARRSAPRSDTGSRRRASRRASGTTASAWVSFSKTPTAG
jgi:catechol 2,3-dioxygenase-like lactoylglutathione lyase family enzyme